MWNRKKFKMRGWMQIAIFTLKRACIGFDNEKTKNKVFYGRNKTISWRGTNKNQKISKILDPPLAINTTTQTSDYTLVVNSNYHIKA
jgi:hypothetical protein